MGTLNPKVDLVRGETLTSFVSRLASVNWMTSTEFCRAAGVRFRDVVDAGGAALDVLSYMVDQDAKSLAASAIVRDDAGLAARGERLCKTDVRRERLFFCPACLREDIASGGKACAHGRLQWSLSAILTCPEHNLSLCEAGPQGGLAAHDIAARLAPLLPHLEAAQELSTEREPSALELYLLRRLETGCGDSPWLDTMTWHVASKTCEVVGAMRTLGRSPNLKILTGQERYEALAEGFQILQGGAPAFRDFLSMLRATFPYGTSGKEGPQVVLGRLYHYLSFSTLDPAFDVVRDVVRDFVVDEFPVSAGTVVLGRKVNKGRTLSVCSASRETGLDRRRLRKLMAATGLLSGQDGVPDARALVDGETADPYLAALKDAVSAKGAQAYLNANKTQVLAIIDGGHIEALTRPDAERGLKERLFARTELDGFLSALMIDASFDVSRSVECPRPIAGAVKLAGCTTAEVIGLIMRRKLDWVGRCSDLEGFASILVDAAEIRRKIGRIQEGFVTTDQIRSALEFDRYEMKRFSDKIGLPIISKDIPLSNMQETLIVQSRADMAISKYIPSSVVIGRLPKNGRSDAELSAYLWQSGIHTAFDFLKVYERDDLPPYLRS